MSGSNKSRAARKARRVAESAIVEPVEVAVAEASAAVDAVAVRHGIAPEDLRRAVGGVPAMMSIESVASELDVHRNTVDRMLAAGKLDRINVGPTHNLVRVDVASLVRHITEGRGGKQITTRQRSRIASSSGSDAVGKRTKPRRRKARNHFSEVA